jgi:hypothetical protein
MRYILFFLTASLCCAHTPDFVWNFRKEIKQYKYIHNQWSMAVLKDKGVGNCVAFSKLAAWHAIKCGHKARLVVLTSPMSECDHQVCVVWEPADKHHKQRLWMFSNKESFVADPEDLPGSYDWKSMWETSWKIRRSWYVKLKALW